MSIDSQTAWTPEALQRLLDAVLECTCTEDPDAAYCECHGCGCDQATEAYGR